MSPAFSNILQTPSHNFVFDFEPDHAVHLSGPMSNEPQPIPGDPDFDSLSKEQISNLFLTYESDDTPPEERAKLHVLFNPTEESESVVNENWLAGPATAQVDRDVQGVAHPDLVATMAAEWVVAREEFLMPQQGPSGCSQDVQYIQTTFPTLDQFTTPVLDLPPWPQPGSSPCDLLQPSAVPQAPLQGHVVFQHEYDGCCNENAFHYHRGPVVDLEAWVAGHPSAYGPPRACGLGAPFSQGQNAHFETGFSTPPGTEYLGYASSTITNMTMVDNTVIPSTSDFDATMDLSGGTSLEPSPSASDGTACAKTRKRKACVETEDGISSSSLTPISRKRRCLDGEEEIGEGKFGVYKEANADAVIMAPPVHDPEPVDSSARRTHDASGDVLQTRWFGAMELDDCYSHRSATITKELPPNMTCVRSCDWTDQPCGLFVEMNMVRIEHHLLHWHGVKFKAKNPCKFKGCSKPRAMLNLGRHIEGVHYTTSHRCCYCKRRWSRADSLDRHLDKCKPLRASKARAKTGRRKFSPLAPKKLVYGYIVPAHDAT
ncbi:hypothetical protein EDB19DRAFT_1347361 [Suillus lakei]|nr:hypothetical protein EDB19DRAFT_1347361 [Suillus lakei]